MGVVPMLIIAVIAIVIIYGVLVSPIIAYTTVEEKTVNITKTDIKRTGSGEDSDDQYLVYTDKGTYKIQDSVWHWQFESSDIYGKLREGKNYKIKCFGFRIGLFSSYKNIYSVSEVPSEL